MKKYILIIILVLLTLAIWVGRLAWNNLKGIGPAVLPPSGQPLSRSGELPIALPKGFSISVYAEGIPGARVMAIDGFNNMWVSQTREGTVSLIESSTGRVNTVFRGLDNPHGLAIHPNSGLTLFIAEEDKISRVALYSEDRLHKIADLPQGGSHVTRTIGFGPDGRLYVSIGSTCNVCVEKDERLASIYSMNADGSDFKKVASGLRNAVFFDWSYVDGRMWATEMGRDLLGDDLPPDEINIISPSTGSGQNPPDFGWPICFGKNIRDTQFDKNTSTQNPCNDKTPSAIDLPAHSAPLGLAFVPEEGWPEDYWYDLIVAFHGSWNRSVPTGYKLVRIKLDAKGNYEGQEDFAVGFLSEDGRTAIGRPVDVITQSGGTMFVSDDKAGMIYKITYTDQN